MPRNMKSSQPPLTPPGVRPATISFWMKTVRSARQRHDDRRRRQRPPRDLLECQHVVDGCRQRARRPAGQHAPNTKLFHEKMKARWFPRRCRAGRAAAPRSGTLHAPPPSISAAFSSSFGSVSKWPAMMYTMIGTVMTRCVMTRAVSVLLRPEELEDGEERDQVGQGRRHPRDQDQHGQLAPAAGRCRSRRARRPRAPAASRTRHDDAVPEIKPHQVVGRTPARNSPASAGRE